MIEEQAEQGVSTVAEGRERSGETTELELSGTSKSFEAAVAGSGDVEAYDLKTEKCELKISGSGTIHASVENELIARISGSGNVKYKGNPRVEDVKVSGSGNVSTY